MVYEGQSWKTEGWAMMQTKYFTLQRIYEVAKENGFKPMKVEHLHQAGKNITGYRGGITVGNFKENLRWMAKHGYACKLHDETWEVDDVPFEEAIKVLMPEGRGDYYDRFIPAYCREKRKPPIPGAQ